VDKIVGWGRKDLPLLRKKPQLSLEEDIAGWREGEVRLQGAIGFHGWTLCPFPRLWLLISAPCSALIVVIENQGYHRLQDLMEFLVLRRR